jgi:hypothetical protein
VLHLGAGNRLRRSKIKDQKSKIKDPRLKSLVVAEGAFKLKIPAEGSKCRIGIWKSEELPPQRHK